MPRKRMASAAARISGGACGFSSSARASSSDAVDQAASTGVSNCAADPSDSGQHGRVVHHGPCARSARRVQSGRHALRPPRAKPPPILTETLTRTTEFPPALAGLDPGIRRTTSEQDLRDRAVGDPALRSRHGKRFGRQAPVALRAQGKKKVPAHRRSPVPVRSTLCEGLCRRPFAGQRSRGQSRAPGRPRRKNGKWRRRSARLQRETNPAARKVRCAARRGRHRRSGPKAASMSAMDCARFELRLELGSPAEAAMHAPSSTEPRLHRRPPARRASTTSPASASPSRASRSAAPSPAGPARQDRNLGPAPILRRQAAALAISASISHPGPSLRGWTWPCRRKRRRRKGRGRPRRSGLLRKGSSAEEVRSATTDGGRCAERGQESGEALLPARRAPARL